MRHLKGNDSVCNWFSEPRAFAVRALSLTQNQLAYVGLETKSPIWLGRSTTSFHAAQYTGSASQWAAQGLCSLDCFRRLPRSQQAVLAESTLLSRQISTNIAPAMSNCSAHYPLSTVQVSIIASTASSVKTAATSTVTATIATVTSTYVRRDCIWEV